MKAITTGKLRAGVNFLVVFLNVLLVSLRFNINKPFFDKYSDVTIISNVCGSKRA